MAAQTRPSTLLGRRSALSGDAVLASTMRQRCVRGSWPQSWRPQMRKSLCLPHSWETTPKKPGPSPTRPPGVSSSPKRARAPALPHLQCLCPHVLDPPLDSLHPMNNPSKACGFLWVRVCLGIVVRSLAPRGEWTVKAAALCYLSPGNSSLKGGWWFHSAGRAPGAWMVPMGPTLTSLRVAMYTDSWVVAWVG